MATKASSPLVHIIEKQHASWASCVAPYLPWSFGFDASPTQPPHGPSWARLAHAPEWWLCMCRAGQWLAIGLHTIQWTTEA